MKTVTINNEIYNYIKRSGGFDTAIELILELDDYQFSKLKELEVKIAQGLPKGYKKSWEYFFGYPVYFEIDGNKLKGEINFEQLRNNRNPEIILVITQVQ
jgi:hypothetical protein